MAKSGSQERHSDRPRRMHIISRKKLREFSVDHPDAEESLNHWYNAARMARWRNFSDLRATFGSADQVGKFIVFNIGGNKYRLIIQIYYTDAVILFRHILSHEEYDQGGWGGQSKR
jgi:mRNA interferase HigB